MKEIKVKTPEEIIKNYREMFKENYIRFIYSESYIQMCEFALRTSTILFSMDVFGILDEDNIQKIRAFMLDNLKIDQEWKKRLVRLSVQIVV